MNHNQFKFTYRITSNNSRGNYNSFTFFTAGIIRGRELLEVLKICLLVAPQKMKN